MKAGPARPRFSFRDATPQQPKQHGWVFEVPATGNANPEPTMDMGVFDHEACAVDPDTGFVYETQDEGGDSGSYRFEPFEPANLAARGRLYMLKVAPLHKNLMGRSSPCHGMGATWTP